MCTVIRQTLQSLRGLHCGFQKKTGRVPLLICRLIPRCYSQGRGPFTSLYFICPDHSRRGDGQIGLMPRMLHKMMMVVMMMAMMMIASPPPNLVFAPCSASRERAVLPQCPVLVPLFFSAERLLGVYCYLHTINLPLPGSKPSLTLPHIRIIPGRYEIVALQRAIALHIVSTPCNVQ